MVESSRRRLWSGLGHGGRSDRHALFLLTLKGALGSLFTFEVPKDGVGGQGADATLRVAGIKSSQWGSTLTEEVQTKKQSTFYQS